MPQNADDLRRVLHRIDGRGYKAYRDLRGEWLLGDVLLCVDHVQGDPFAAPSRLRLRVAAAEAGFPPALWSRRARRIALEDWLARRGARSAPSARRGSGRSGLVRIDAGGQQVLERSAARVTDAFVELRLSVGLPAAGRRVLGREAEALLCVDLPELADAALRHASQPSAELEAFVDCIDNQEQLRALLPERGLLAFVGDGACLPRESGASDRPLRADEAVPFASPDSLRVELPLAHPVETPAGRRESWVGMGIPRGVTLVVGGGYHGKSTLLRALERGVYPHVPGDGREWVVSDRSLVKIRAEDGRRVEKVDISAFIGDLPRGRSTRAFSSDDASGSTSQAASIVEAVEAGASGLLLDEDTSATNFMVRDARMQALVRKGDEPITPFVERVRELHEKLGISTVLVMGGSGDYFEAADRVIAMRDFAPADVSEAARRIAREMPTGRSLEAAAPLGAAAARSPEPASFDASRGRRDVKIEARGVDLVLYGEERLELRGVEQLVETSQTRALGHAIHLAARRLMADGASLREVIDRLEALLDAEGLDVLDPFQRPGQHPGDFARPRGLEVAAGINRLRSLRMRQQGGLPASN